MASGHFIVRRLEKIHGAEPVRVAYEKTLRRHFTDGRLRARRDRDHQPRGLQGVHEPWWPRPIAQYGGKFLERGGPVHVLEGEWPQCRRVIIEFASRERALEWYNSPEYEKPLAMRQANCNGRLLLLDGV